MMVFVNSFRLEQRKAALFLCVCFAISVFTSAVTMAQSGGTQVKPSVSADRSQTDPGASLIHGNYCGPGERPGTRPIDALDAACKRHDACMPSKGLPSCSCMATLEREAGAIARNPSQPPDIQLLASATAAGAALSPCKKSR